MARLEKVFGRFKDREALREVLKRREGDKVRSLLEEHYRKSWALNIDGFLQAPYEAFRKRM